MNLVFRLPDRLLLVDSEARLREVLADPVLSRLESFCSGVICDDESRLNDYVISRLISYYRTSTSIMMRIEPYRLLKPLDEEERRSGLPDLKRRCIRISAFGEVGKIAAAVLNILSQLREWAGEYKV